MTSSRTAQGLRRVRTFWVVQAHGCRRSVTREGGLPPKALGLELESTPPNQRFSPAALVGRNLVSELVKSLHSPPVFRVSD
jgi:hypothetical protein